MRLCTGGRTQLRAWRLGFAVVGLGALAMPASALAAVSSITAGQGIVLSTNPCTSTCSVSLAPAITASSSSPLLALTNTGSGNGLSVTGPVAIRAYVNGSGNYAVEAHGGNSGAGVLGYGGSTGGNGVQGDGSGSGYGVVGQGAASSTGTAGSGIKATGGKSSADFGSGGNGVYATGGSVTGNDGFGGNGLVGYGGSGATSSGDGVMGNSANGNGVYGAGATGVEGFTNGGGNPVGVYGDDASNSGVGGKFTSLHGAGVNASGASYGVDALVSTNGGVGVSGYDESAGGGYGGHFGSDFGVALYAINANPDSNPNDAAIIDGGENVIGNLNVTGTISAGVKDFKIDDPLDPANKYLVHTSVESPDAEDVYSGNVTTDGKGYATVALPAYFDAENIDPRYQLTAVGSKGWDARVGVFKPESGNQFVIRSSPGGVEVSWQVTGTRNDPYARSVRAPAEQLKPAADRDRYLYPAGYGQPASAAIPAAPGIAAAPAPAKATTSGVPATRQGRRVR